MYPNDANAHLLLAFPMIANGQAEETIPDLEKTATMMHRSPGALELLATAHARAGHRAEALRLLEELKQCRKTGYVQATSFINPNLGLGNYDEAFVWFERAYHEREGSAMAERDILSLIQCAATRASRTSSTASALTSIDSHMFRIGGARLAKPLIHIWDKLWHRPSHALPQPAGSPASRFESRRRRSQRGLFCIRYAM